MGVRREATVVSAKQATPPSARTLHNEHGAVCRCEHGHPSGNASLLSRVNVRQLAADCHEHSAVWQQAKR